MFLCIGTSIFQIFNGFECFDFSHWDRICKVCIKIAYSNFTSESHWQSSPHWNYICEHSICSPYWNSTHFFQEMPLVTKKNPIIKLTNKIWKVRRKVVYVCDTLWLTHVYKKNRVLSWQFHSRCCDSDCLLKIDLFELFDAMQQRNI